MNKTSLEEKSLWYEYKSDFWPQETQQSINVHNIMRTLRSIHNQGELAYVSVPITSGRRYYQEMCQNPDQDLEILMKKLISHNYTQGWKFVEELKKRKNIPILYPADLVPRIEEQKWRQGHFQALWLSIIAEKATEHHMCQNWEYSNGGAEELTHTFQLKLGIPKDKNLVFYNTKEDEQQERKRMKNIQVYDSKGNPITIDSAISKLDKSISWIQGLDFSTPVLTHCRSLLEWTGEMIEKGFYQ